MGWKYFFGQIETFTIKGTIALTGCKAVGSGRLFLEACEMLASLSMDVPSYVIAVSLDT